MRITDLDEGLHANVAESFDKKVAWKTGFSSKYSREFYAEIDGTLLTVDYFSPDAFESTVEVSFRRNGEQSITGEGKAHTIFGAVVNHINDFVQEYDLDRVIFAAHKPQGSFGVRDTARSDTYRKMMKKLSNTLGFDYSVEDRGNNDIFTLTKKDRQIKEEQTPDIIDNVEGWGNVPLNQNVDYMGLRVKMKPSVFLRLAAPMDREPSDAIVQHIKNGGKIGSPFLNISIPSEWEDGDISENARVSGHEGRNRMKAILRLHGDIPIETHLFFAGGIRRRHLTDKMISSMKSKMQSEKSKKTLNGPLFITNTNINEWGRIVKGVNTTPDVNTDEIKEQTTGARLPIKTLKNLFHVGTLDASKKGFSYEGAGLSVSTHPDAWRKITKGTVSGNTYSATKEGNRFLNAHELSDKHKEKIKQWAIENGYLEEQETVTVCFYDDELSDNLCQTFNSMTDAENAYDDELEDMDVTVNKNGIVPTDKLKKETRQTHIEATGVLEYVLPIFAEQQGLDGVWWQDKLDVYRYSAPRGVIVPSKIKSWKFSVNEAAGAGRVVKGVNTTPDVNTDEIKTQAAKFGNRVDRDGRPPLLGKKTRGSKTNVLFNLGLAEGVYYKNDILLENVIYEGFLDSAKTYLGNKFNQTANDIQGAVSDFKTAGILIKDIVSDQDYLVLVNAQLNKNIGTLTKQINRLSSGNQIISNIWNKIKNIVFSIKNAKNWKGFLGKLGIYGFLKFIVTNTNNIKDTVINLLLDKVTDLENIIPNATLGGFLQIFEGLQFVKKYFLDILSIIKKKLEFGKNIKKESKVLNELIMDTSGISFDSNWKGEYWGKRITQIPGNPQSASDYREFEIFFAGTSQKRSVYITDKKERIVGRLELMKISNKAPIYRVNVAVMAGKFRGKNIMQGVYVHLIQEHGMTLAADITQSPGAMRSWAKLNRNPAITVFSAVEDKDGKWEYSQLEGDNFLSGSSIIYRSEYDDMIREIQNEISSIEKAIETARKEYKQSRNTEILSDIDYLINRIKKLEDEILKIKKEKKQRELAGIDKTFLLATRSKKLPATESTIKINTSSIFPELEQELAEGPRDAIRKLAKGAAVATSIGTAGFMGTMNTGDDPKSSRKSTGAEYVQTQKSTDKKTAEPEPEIKTQPEVSGSELAPEKSIRPDARPTDITITNKPAEKTLIKYARNAGINGTELASLLAQVAVETSGYDQMVETGSSKYFHRYEKEHSPRLAKMLGNTEPGDGYKYRGRGYVQLTGRYNYNEAGKALGLDLINNPELAAEPKNALKIALWFWEWRVASNTDDYDNTKRVTRLLNGGSHGLEKRKKYFDVYKDRLKELGFTENKKTYPYMEKYTPLQIAIIEGGHTLDEEDVAENKRKNRLFDALMEGIRIQLERDDDLYVLHIKDSKQKHRVEVRGKSGYESGNYDEDDPLHQLIDNLGKAANISDLINGEPVYINPDHPDGPRAIRYLKAAMNESKDTEIKIHNTSVLDHYRGESFGEKLLSVDGILKARIKLSILGDEVYIQYIETAEDSKRMGYAKKLVDDLFREFPNKTISVSMMTGSGSKFFRSQYRVDDKTGELKQIQKAEK